MCKDGRIASVHELMRNQNQIAALALLPGLLSFSGSALAGWRPMGPFGGDAAVVRVVPQVLNMVVAAARNGLLFVSSNGGASWTNLPFPGQFTGVLHALEVDPRAAGTWYAGMEGEHAWSSGVYKTTDSGRTWKFLPGMTGKAVWSLALFPADEKIIAAGTADGVYESADGGSNWKLISQPDNQELRPVVSLAFHPVDSAILLAGTTHLPWRTGDGGASWQSIHTGMIDDSDVFSIAVNARQPEMVYASACSGVYQSSNGAALWSRMPTPAGAFRTHFVALDPHNERTIFAGTTEGLLRSEDEGHSWHQVSAHSVQSISFDSNVAGRVFFASSTGGLLVSTDSGKTLRETNAGFTNRNFTAIEGSGGVVYANSVYEPGSGGVYRTDDMGLRWRRSGSEPAGQQILLMTAVPGSPAQVYAAGYHGLLKSTDGGKTWTPQKGPGTDVRITSLVALATDVLLAGTEKGLYKSTQHGWVVVPSASEMGTVKSVQRSGTATVTALTSRGAYVSTDAAVSWQACTSPSPSAVWYGLTFDTAKASPGLNHRSMTALAATSVGLFRSIDGCKTWAGVERGLRADTVGLVLFHPTRSGEAFASQGGHVFRSVDSGMDWERLEDDDQADTWPSALLVLPSAPERLFALFPRRGIFSKLVEGPLPATAH